jgi:hypothetical protein
MQYATCITEASYHGALTYGRKYAMLAIKDDPHHPNVKIQGDNGRVRWFPAYCFDLSGSDVPLLQMVTICDDLLYADTSTIEVHVQLSDGQERWCFFVTPASLTQSGDWIDGTTIRIHYGAPHMIIVDQINAEIIEQALHHIEVQGELLACTIGIEKQDETDSE